MVTFKIPTPLRPMTGGSDEVTVEGATVREALDNLDGAHNGIKARICDDAGELRRFINMYIGEEDVRGMEGLDTAVEQDSVLSIIPAIAGGL